MLSPRSLALRCLSFLALPALATAQGQLIDMSGWQAINYELNFQPDASWDLQPGNTSVLQSVNSDASIFLSDFDAVGQEIRGTWRVQTSGDDDFMGFVFGYQGRGQFYLFDWKQGSQTHQGDFAEVGMSLKIVDMPAGSDPTQDDLWPSAGSPNVSVPLHNTISWSEFVDYEFVLEWTPGNIHITVLEGGQVLEDWVLADSTFTSGAFGFYNYSQDQVLYQGFTQAGAPEIYCAAKQNAQGCVPVLNYTGYASMTDTAAFDITATMLLNQQNGGLVYSKAGRDNIPFGGGTLCLAMPLQFTAVMNTGGSGMGSDCSGLLSVDLNALLQSGTIPAVLAGDQINVQYFYRDPMHLDGSGYGLTEGVEFFVLP